VGARVRAARGSGRALAPAAVAGITTFAFEVLGAHRVERVGKLSDTRVFAKVK